MGMTMRCTYSGHALASDTVSSVSKPQEKASIALTYNSNLGLQALGLTDASVDFYR